MYSNCKMNLKLFISKTKANSECNYSVLMEVKLASYKSHHTMASFFVMR
jgi:hypothetical protein